MINNDIQVEIPNETRKAWQEIVDILAETANIPAGLVMRLNDPYLEVFLSSEGDGNPYHPGDKENVWGSGLYCETVLKTRSKLLVPNATKDKHWENNPDIKLNMISYLGLPILWPDGKLFGTLCVLDNKENAYSKNFEKLLVKFRDFVQSDLEMLYVNQVLGDKNKRLVDYLMELQTLRGMVSICSNCKNIKDNRGRWHPVEHYLIRHPEADFSHGICPNCMKKLYSDRAEND